MPHIDVINHKLKYKWDRLGRLTRLTNENGASYEFFYDIGGRLIKEIDFDDKETIYHYDEGTGQLATSIEVAMLQGQNLSGKLAPKDRIQHFVMDSMGRLEQRTSGFGYKGQNELEEQQLEEFAYNSHGQILLAKNAESKVDWFYDVVGNLVREHIQDNKTDKTAVWKHGYDEINDRIKTIRPDGQNVDWLTYGTGHVHSLILNGHDIVSFERDDLHRETARHYANGLSQFEHYDEQGRLSQQQIVKVMKMATQMSNYNKRIMRFKIQRVYYLVFIAMINRVNLHRFRTVVVVTFIINMTHLGVCLNRHRA